MLGGMRHIEDLSINVVGRYAVMKHCPMECCAPAGLIVGNLNKERLGASIQEHFDEGAEEEAERIDRVAVAHAAFTAVFFVVCAAFDGVHREDHTLDSPVNKMYLACTAIGCVPIAFHAGTALSTVH